MAQLTGPDRARYVQGMFARIARRYDRMNRLMTAGQDVRWRREVIRRAALPPRGRLLDLGAGTGDLVYEALRLHPDCQVVAADFTIEMMAVGKDRFHLAKPPLDHQTAKMRTFPAANLPSWCAADALCLPYPAGTFTAVVSGFLLRNLADLQRGLAEQYRVLREGGWLVALDTTRPQRGLLYPFIRLYMRAVIPILGRLVAGDAEAYTYLPDSTGSFLSAEQLAARLTLAGFREVGFRRAMFGTVAIHWGRK